MVKVLHVVFVVAVILIIAVGAIFIFGSGDLQRYNNERLLEDNSISGGAEEAESAGGNILEKAIESIGEIVGVGDSDAGGDSSEEVIDGVNCEMQQIQYSLKNFKNNVECADAGVGGCVKLAVNCSMEVYNLDSGVDGIFGIRYFLADSNGEELDFELIQKDVKFDVPEIFSAEFVKSDASGVDENLTCSFTVETIPKKEICS